MSTHGESQIVEVDEQLPIERIEIDFLMLADWAENINGKLYIQGGSWDRKLRPPKDRPVITFAITAGILVPWQLTNQLHEFKLTLETGDGAAIGPSVTGGFNMGRPVKASPGQKLRIPFAAQIGAPLPELGAYAVKLTVNNDITKTTAFYIVEEL